VRKPSGDIAKRKGSFGRINGSKVQGTRSSRDGKHRNVRRCRRRRTNRGPESISDVGWICEHQIGERPTNARSTGVPAILVVRASARPTVISGDPGRHLRSRRARYKRRGPPECGLGPRDDRSSRRAPRRVVPVEPAGGQPAGRGRSEKTVVERATGGRGRLVVRSSRQNRLGWREQGVPDRTGSGAARGTVGS